MITKPSRLAAALASVAAFSMSASPALARDWGGGWGGHRRHGDGVDAGDVLAGILIIGGIAAIASAASSAGKQRRPAPPPEPTYDRGYAGDTRPVWQGSNSIDDAVGRCLDEVSRGSGRADAVDTVSRDGDGWRVMGRTADGSSFACSVNGAGRIRSASVGGRAL